MERGIYSRTGFISYQSKKIEELIENGKMLLAKKIILDLLNDYSNDFQLLKSLARIYTIEHDYENAKKILLDIEEVYGYKKLASIYMKLNEEEKLFELYKKYYSDDSILDQDREYDENERRMKLYLEKKFNSSFEVNFDELSYYEKQIYSYDKNRAIDHIIKYHYNKYHDKSTFNSEINIVELFDKVSEYILNNNERGTLGKSAGENYYFNYRRCGLRNEKNQLVYTNTFKVCVLIGTNKIISMFPCKEVNESALCYLESENIKSNVKVKTGIERFNSKYGKFY